MIREGNEHRYKNVCAAFAQLLGKKFNGRN